MVLTLAIHCPKSVRKENEAFLIKGVDTFLCTRPFGRRNPTKNKTVNPTKNKTVRGNPKRTILYSGWSGLLQNGIRVGAQIDVKTSGRSSGDA